MQDALSTQPRERRRSPRKQTHDRRFWHPAPGKILDATPRGMSVQTKRKLEVGETYTFRTRYESQSLRIPGIVMWSRLETTSPNGTGKPLTFYRAGILLADGLGGAAEEFLLGHGGRKPRSS